MSSQPQSCWFLYFPFQYFVDINADEARSAEERQMMTDANYWKEHPELPEIENTKTGATALHVSSAKGYHKVMM